MFTKNNKDTNSKGINIFECIEHNVSTLIKELENIYNEFYNLYNGYGFNQEMPKIESLADRWEHEKLVCSDGYKYARELTLLIKKDFRRIKGTAISLSELLEDNKKEFYQNQIKSIDIEKIQKKKYISVKEFTEIYSFSEDWQKNRRARIRDRLPFIQTTDGGKITYNVEEIEIWFDNNNIAR